MVVLTMAFMKNKAFDIFSVINPMLKMGKSLSQ